MTEIQKCLTEAAKVLRMARVPESVRLDVALKWLKRANDLYQITRANDNRLR